jgi:hypothetical protein
MSNVTKVARAAVGSQKIVVDSGYAVDPVHYVSVPK